MDDTINLLSFPNQKLEPHYHRINGTIAEAIHAYEARGVPLQQLLSDYLDVITDPYQLSKAVNPWAHIKNKRGELVVRGVSTAEAIFTVSAMSLYKQRPITVIKSIYYRNKARNDSAIERVFLSAFQSTITADQKVLVINPSPFIVESIETTRKKTVYAVIDQTMANLYSRQFLHADFVPIDDIYSITDVDVMIILTTNIDDALLRKMLEYIRTVHAERIYGIVQTRLLDCKESLFWKVLSNGCYAIRNIVIIPNEVSNTTPRKKCLISIESNTSDASTRDKPIMKRELTIRKMEYNSSVKIVSLADLTITIKHEELMRCKTLNQLWKRASTEEAGRGNQEKGKKKTIYSSAELYTYSREIQISYTLYRDTNGIYAKAYYAETKNTHLPGVRGKALTPRVERGLHAKTVDQVIDALEKVPFNKRIIDSIIADIKTHYLNAGTQVTLKTLWFCLRYELQKNPSYDDDTMVILFSRGKSISDLYPGIDSGDAFKRTIDEQLKEGEEEKEFRLLKMVNIVISEAVKRGYLTENRILPLIPDAQKRATRRQAEVRQALAKRSLELVEEQRALQFLLPICVKSSINLSVVIRLMTGISVKEVCGLLWSNFRYNVKLDIYTLSVTKFVDSKGKMIHHVTRNNWEKYRILPISTLLGRILCARKDYLNKEGLEDQVLEEYPIILPCENLDHMRKGYKSVCCKPVSVAEKCRKAIEAADIPQFMILLPDKDGNDIETDINSYNGDIFRTNFRDKALNEAGFELDEVHYYLGLKKPDTFAQHYCDYSNPYVQLIMARKLDRWQSRYGFRNQVGDKRPSVVEKNRGIGEGVPCVEINTIKSITDNDVDSAPITIDVESKHGFKIAISSNNQSGKWEGV